MKAVIAGSTGMVGSLVLEQCIQSDLIDDIVTLVRRPSSFVLSEKVSELVVEDFETYANQEVSFVKVDIAFFCLGAYTGQVKDELFKKITYDYAVAFARMVKAHNPKARLCLLSGQGADRTEKSTTAFARYKGMAENAVADLLPNFHSFRPGYIYPVTPRKEPNFMYSLSRTLYPLFKLMGRNMSIKSTELAEAMFLVGLHGAKKEVLENADILDELERLRLSGRG
jgi:uncharacterized protein YbjT (DUF2867 family)